MLQFATEIAGIEVPEAVIRVSEFHLIRDTNELVLVTKQFANMAKYQAKANPFKIETKNISAETFMVRVMAGENPFVVCDDLLKDQYTGAIIVEEPAAEPEPAEPPGE